VYAANVINGTQTLVHLSPKSINLNRALLFGKCHLSAPRGEEKKVWQDPQRLQKSVQSPLLYFPLIHEYYLHGLLKFIRSQCLMICFSNTAGYSVGRLIMNARDRCFLKAEFNIPLLFILEGRKRI
jgi:hypothetical protein